MARFPLPPRHRTTRPSFWKFFLARSRFSFAFIVAASITQINARSMPKMTNVKYPFVTHAVTSPSGAHRGCRCAGICVFQVQHTYNISRLIAGKHNKTRKRQKNLYKAANDERIPEEFPRMCGEISRVTFPKQNV